LWCFKNIFGGINPHQWKTVHWLLDSYSMNVAPVVMNWIYIPSKAWNLISGI
jgi:hypothetical protein